MNEIIQSLWARKSVRQFEERPITQEDEFTGYIKAFCTRKYMSDFAKEMNRSAKRYLEHFKGV